MVVPSIAKRPLFLSIAIAASLLGCVGCGGGSNDAAVTIDAKDPYLVEAEETKEYVPQITASDDQ